MVALGPPGVWDRVGHVDFMRFLVEYGLKGFSDRLFEHSTRNALKQFANPGLGGGGGGALPL